MLSTVDFVDRRLIELLNETSFAEFIHNVVVACVAHLQLVGTSHETWDVKKVFEMENDRKSLWDG